MNEGPKREGPPSGPFLPGRAHRLALSASFAGWGLILIIFFTGKFETWTRRDDLIGLVQTTAALAAIGLGILTLIQEIRNRNRYLKLLLAGVTIAFLLTTLAGWLAVLTIKPGEHDLRSLTVRFLVFGIVYLSVGVSGVPLTLRVERKWISVFERFYDYSFFVFPAGGFLLWSRDLSWAATTIVLSLGGMVYLVCGAIILMVFAWRVRSYEEQLGERAFEIIRSFRDRDQTGRRNPALVTLDYLRNRLASDNDTLRDAIETLRREDRVVEVERESYYLPVSNNEADRGRDVIRNFDVVAANLSGNADSWRDVDAFLGRELRLPVEVVRQYFNAGLQELINEEFLRSDAYMRGYTYYVYFKQSSLGRLRQVREGPLWGDFWKKGYLSDKEKEALGNEILSKFSCFPSHNGFEHMPEVIALSVWKLQSKV